VKDWLFLTQNDTISPRILICYTKLANNLYWRPQTKRCLLRTPLAQQGRDHKESPSSIHYILKVSHFQEEIILRQVFTNFWRLMLFTLDIFLTTFLTEIKISFALYVLWHPFACGSRIHRAKHIIPKSIYPQPCKFAVWYNTVFNCPPLSFTRHIPDTKLPIYVTSHSDLGSEREVFLWYLLHAKGK
jgi:hypothetical protein